MSLIKKEPGTLLSLPKMNTLSHHLSTYRSTFSKITSLHPRIIMQTLNGKLVSEDLSKLDKLKQNMENLAQQFEDLELKMTTISENDKVDYLKQIVSVQLSLQKLERIYSRLLSTTILVAIGLASWSVALGFNHDQAAKQVKSTVNSTLTQQSANH